MPRLGPQRPRVMKRVLRENGLVEGRPRGRTQGKGSHAVWEHPDDPTRSTTVPDYDMIDPGLAHKIIVQSGKTVEEYLVHLR